MMRRMRSFVSRLMDGLSLQVRETVDGETPAAAAISLIVTAYALNPLSDSSIVKGFALQSQRLRTHLRKSRNGVAAKV